MKMERGKRFEKGRLHAPKWLKTKLNMAKVKGSAAQFTDFEVNDE